MGCVNCADHDNFEALIEIRLFLELEAGKLKLAPIQTTHSLVSDTKVPSPTP